MITLTFTGKLHDRLYKLYVTPGGFLPLKDPIVTNTTVLDEEVRLEVAWENRCAVGHQNSQRGKTLILKTLILILLLLIKHSDTKISREHLLLANKIASNCNSKKPFLL